MPRFVGSLFMTLTILIGLVVIVANFPGEPIKQRETEASRLYDLIRHQHDEEEHCGVCQAQRTTKGDESDH
jgi:hypothetical protein